MEVTFFLEVAALRQLCPDMKDVEAGFLNAFDTTRSRIDKVAEKVYVGGRKNTYAFLLAADDF